MKKILFLLLTAVCALLYAPPANADTVYFNNEEWNDIGFKGFTTPYCWFVSGTTNNRNHILMTHVSGKVYKVDYTRDSGELTIIFTDGTSWTDQTADLTNNDANGKIFRINSGAAKNRNGFWETYSGGGGGGSTTQAPVHMPLKKSDFANGPRYFLVGTRMGDWRLQPEWEFTVAADKKSATLSGRLMYKGMFGVAKVENYDDYIHHKYTLYVNNKYYVTSSAHNNIELNSHRAAQAIRYDDNSTTGQFSENNTMIWNTDGKGWDSDPVKESAPALLELVTLDLSGANPKITFNYTDNKADVAAARTFSLVGENFRYEVLNENFTDGIARNIDSMTPQQTRSGANSKGWGNGWVLYDENGAPYVDAYGNVMFCTAYDKDWLAKHPVQFYNENQKMTYSSLGTVFLPWQELDKLDEDSYADLYKMHPAANGSGSNRIGGTTGSLTGVMITSPNGTFSYQEVMDNHYRSEYWHDNSNWQCYVVKGMWINGPFKVWAGWGGNIKAYDGVGDGDSESAERWNYENGGHNQQNTDYVISGSDATNKGGKVNVYGMTRDMNGANFKINGMTYYDRVILWYNPDDGIHKSVLQLVQSTYGPNIRAYYNPAKRKTLRYEWKINTTDNTPANYLITGYTITRYKVVDGRDTQATVVNRVTGYNKKVSERTGWLNELDDRNALAPGMYRYKIEATFQFTEDGQQKTTTKDAYSNTITINETATPVELTAEQQMDEQNRYTFNAEVNASPVAEILDRVVDETSKKTAKDLMKWYILVTDDTTKTRLDKANKLEAGNTAIATENGIKGFWTLSDGTNARVGQNEYVESGLWFHKFEITETDRADITKISMPKLVWHNVYPTRSADGSLYKLKNDNYEEVDNSDLNFSVYLTCNDNTTDFAAWDFLNFEAGIAATPVVAPTAAIYLDAPFLQKSTFTDYNSTKLHSLKHPDGGRLSNLYKENVMDGGTLIHSAGEHNEEEGPLADDPVYFDVFNESVAPLLIDPLKVADEVAQNWDIHYIISVRPASSDYNPAVIPDKHKVELFNTDRNNPIDPQKELSVNAYDLDLSSLQTLKSLDGRHENYIDGTNSTLAFQAHIQVSYLSKSNKIVNNTVYNLDSPQSNNTLALKHEKPTIVQKASAFSKYKAQYYGEDMSGNVGKQTLDYLAHAVVGFDIQGYRDIDLYPYIAFDAQQKLFYCEHHKGVYKEPHAPYYQHSDCQDWAINGPVNWWKLSFAGTRAANGGHPMNKGWDETVTNIVPSLSCDNSDGGNALDYYDYAPAKKGDPMPDHTDPMYNWSRIAARSGYLPIHINPVKRFSAESFETDNTLAGADAITAKFAVVYPILTLGEYTSLPAVIVSNGSSANAAPAADSATLSPDRNGSGYELKDVYMMALTNEKPIDFSKSTITGVDEIVVDYPGLDGDAEFYNLQGIRVMNPAKGQIYIVRHGDKSFKLLY